MWGKKGTSTSIIGVPVPLEKPIQKEKTKISEIPRLDPPKTTMDFVSLYILL